MASVGGFRTKVHSTFCKLLQKQTYDVLSHRYGTLALLLGGILLLISAFQFGEVALEWSREKYAALSNSLTDNIAGKSFRNRLCLPVPIDVVYTWVNGSDPKVLDGLRLVQRELERDVQSNDTGEVCTFSHCLQTSSVVVEPALPVGLTVSEFVEIYPAFSKAVNFKVMKSPQDEQLNVTVVKFQNVEDVAPVLKEVVVFNGINHTVKEAYLTSDWTVRHSILLDDTIIMTGFPHTYKADELKAKFPSQYSKAIEKLELYKDNAVAVLYVPVKQEFENLLQDSNFTIDGKEPTLHAANMVWYFSIDLESEQISANRFQDNDELRYSLRSIELHAPWVRHIYIITNGQIPSWLDLENPRVTLVTHQEIFPNQSHLPTYSSPAIEVHLHRIPGLSDKFIYMNDDVMFGKDVWPDDFYTHAGGQKVYLTWPVPNCQEGCPNTWIRDGYCDKACNSSECDWDGGDCKGGHTQVGSNNFGAQFSQNSFDSTEELYCNSGCANNWVADRYCDQACNVLSCGFDAGDCGNANFNQLHKVDILPRQHHYRLPGGFLVYYFNLTAIFPMDASGIRKAEYEKHEVIRTAAVSNKYKTMTLLLYSKHNDTELNFKIAGRVGLNHSIEFEFNVTVNTWPLSTKKAVIDSSSVNVTSSKDASNDTVKMEENVTEAPFSFTDVPKKIRSAFPVQRTLESDLDRYQVMNISNLQLSGEVMVLLKQLQESFKQGDLTDKGFNIRKAKLLKQHFQSETPGSKQEEATSKTSRLELNQRKSLDQNPKDSQNLHQKSPEVSTGRKLTSYNDGEFGSFPWERQGLFAQLIEKKKTLQKMHKYQSTPYHSRKLMDTFADSLRHVNKLYNKEFGYAARKVPGHMPHMIDKNIMMEMQEKFSEEWETTSSHRVRSSDDMQFAFSYFYFMMSQPANSSVEAFLKEMDTDHSRCFSDREIRLLATRIFELPILLETLSGFEEVIKNCSRELSADIQAENPPPPREQYYDTELPQVTMNLMLNCEPVVELIQKHLKGRTKYKFEEVGEEEIAFKMLESNVSRVLGQLDDIRKNPKKFVCLNDNLKHGLKEAETVRAIQLDFYETFYPIPSQFELPKEYRNRYLYVEDLKEWKLYRDRLRFMTHCALGILIFISIYSFFAEKIESLARRYWRRRLRGQAVDV